MTKKIKLVVGHQSKKGKQGKHKWGLYVLLLCKHCLLYFPLDLEHHGFFLFVYSVQCYIACTQAKTFVLGHLSLVTTSSNFFNGTPSLGIYLAHYSYLY